MRISDWSSDVCSSDLSWAFTKSGPGNRHPAAFPDAVSRQVALVACGGAELVSYGCKNRSACPYTASRFGIGNTASITPAFFISCTFFFNVYFSTRERQRDRERDRDRDRSPVGEGQGERETQNPKQAPGSEPSTQSPSRGLNSRTERSRPELKLDA